MKTCAQCQLSKELTDFSPSGPSRPGLLKRRCKACINLNSQAKRKEDPELARQKSRDRYLKESEKRREAARERYRRDPEKFRAVARTWSPEKRKGRMLRYTYGISLEKYNAMFLEQAGKCAICKEDEGERSLCVDHDHVTGKVRALLCASCNTGLGRFKDLEELVRRAADYLRYHARLGKEPEFDRTD